MTRGRCGSLDLHRKGLSPSISSSVRATHPVDPLKQVAELRRADRHRTARRCRPREPAALQTLGVERRADPVGPEDLHEVAFASAEYEEIARMRVTTSEALYQAAKFAAAPEVQRCIARAPTAREAAAIGRGTPEGLNPDWNAHRVNAMRWVLRMKREANAAAIDAALARSGERAIVEVSTRDAWWGAKPVGGTYRGENVLGRLWMELRQQLRDGDPASRAAAWTGRIDVGRLADPPCA